MKVVALSVFLHGKMRFEKDLGYGVPDALGQYFVKNGWAKAAPTEMTVHTVPDWILSPAAKDRDSDTLEVQDVHVTLNPEVK